MRENGDGQVRRKKARTTAAKNSASGNASLAHHASACLAFSAASRSSRLEDQVGVGEGIARPNKPDGVRNAFLKFAMRFERERNSSEAAGERGVMFGSVEFATFA